MTEPELVETTEETTAVIGDVVEVADLPVFFDRSFTSLAEVISSQGVAIMGPAFALFHGPPGETADLEVGFVTDRPVAADGDVRAASLPGGRVARLVHIGGFDLLGSSWAQLRAWIDSQGLVAGRDLWEVYVTEPSPDMDPADLRTELNWLVDS